MKRPYLTPELDERYQLVESRDGCFGLWGEPIFRGIYIGKVIVFKHIGFYPTGQAEGGPAIEIRHRLAVQDEHILKEIATGYLYTWLDNLPVPQSDLLKKTHNFQEIWKVRDNLLSVIIVWGWQEADPAIIPDCVQRLVQVAEIIENTHL